MVDFLKKGGKHYVFAKMKTVTITKSNIKGYHFIKVRPRSDIPMKVEIEEDNIRDPNAMSIKMPSIDDIHLSLHKEITRAGNKTRKEQRVCDIAGKQVGRVPANLCKLLRQLLKDCSVTKITCLMTDPPCLSQIPPAQQSYKRNLKGDDRRGGGAVIHYKYLLSCYNATYEKVTKFMKNAVDKLRYQGTEEVEVEESRFSHLADKKADSCPW